MSNESRKLLIQAFRAWVVEEIDAQLLIPEEKMATIQEYKAAVDTTMVAILKAMADEKELIDKLAQAAKAQNGAMVDAAIIELAQSKAQMLQAVTGMISTEPNPTTPPVATTDATLPEVVVPELPTTTPSDTNAEVPISITPVPDGIGVAGASMISQ